VAGNDAPQIRGSTLIGFIEAARRLEGDSLDQLRSALEADLVRTLFDDLVLASSWFPESTLVGLCEAVFRGPLREAPAPYAAYLGRSVDLGWGRVQRALVGFATPKMLAERAAKLWRREHSHGELVAEVTGNHASLALRGHPYADTPFSRALIAELLRYIVSLTRVGVVRQTHALEAPGALRIELEW
jgi:hypothetical protein